MESLQLQWEPLVTVGTLSYSGSPIVTVGTLSHSGNTLVTVGTPSHNGSPLVTVGTLSHSGSPYNGKCPCKSTRGFWTTLDINLSLTINPSGHHITPLGTFGHLFLPSYQTSKSLLYIQLLAIIFLKKDVPFVPTHSSDHRTIIFQKTALPLLCPMSLPYVLRQPAGASAVTVGAPLVTVGTLSHCGKCPCKSTRGFWTTLDISLSLTNNPSGHHITLLGTFGHLFLLLYQTSKSIIIYRLLAILFLKKDVPFVPSHSSGHHTIIFHKTALPLLCPLPLLYVLRHHVGTSSVTVGTPRHYENILSHCGSPWSLWEPNLKRIPQ